MCDHVISVVLCISNRDYNTLEEVQKRFGEIHIEQVIERVIAEYCNDERYVQDGGEIRYE